MGWVGASYGYVSKRIPVSKPDTRVANRRAKLQKCRGGGMATHPYIYIYAVNGGGGRPYIYIYVQSLLELAGAGVSLLGRLFTKEDLPMASTIPLRSDTRRVGTRCSQDSLHFRLLLMFAGWLQCAQDAPCMEWSYALQWRVLQAATLTMHDHRILFGCQCRNSGRAVAQVDKW